MNTVTAYCKQACKRHEIFEIDRGILEGGYDVLRCRSCSGICYQCKECLRSFSGKNHDRTAVRRHMENGHCSVPVLNQVGSQLMETDVPLCMDINASTSFEAEDFMDGGAEGFNVDDMSVCSIGEDVDLFLDMDYEDFEGENDYFSEENLVQQWLQLPSFGNATSDIYYEQDFNTYHMNNEVLGGIRGICWRSRYRLNLHEGVSRLSNIMDTKYIFNITNLLLKNTESTNSLLYEVLTETTDRMECDFDSENPGVRIPRTDQEARKICLDGKFGIFNNLPCPTVHDVGGHACMKIGDVLHHHFAQGRDFEYTVNGDGVRVWHGIHGSLAMTELIDLMSALDLDG